MKKPLLPVLLAYMAGIITGNYHHLPLAPAMAGMMGACLGLVIFLAGGKRKTALFFTPSIFFLLGLLFIGRVVHPDLPSDHLFHLAGEKKYHIEGVLYRPPEPMQERTRLFVRGERIHLQHGSFPVTGNLLVTVKDRQCGLRYGDRVRFISPLYQPRAATNPGGFDYRQFLALQEIRVTAYVNDFTEIVRMEEGRGNPFLQAIEAGREEIRTFLDKKAPARSRGIIKALVLGERGDIDRETNEKFIISGVTHILSISGLHVALVAAFFFGATRWVMKLFPFFLLRLDLNKTSALAAVVPVIFYTFIAGLGVAAVRSTIMTVSFLAALLLDRGKDLYDALFLAAFLILVVNPAAFFDLSFQLSFLSVLAMLYLIPRFAGYFSWLKNWTEEQGPWKRKVLFYFGGSLLASGAAILGTGPLVVYYFNRISLVGFLSNLLLVPLMGLGNTLLSLLAALAVFLYQPLAGLLTNLNVRLLDVALGLVDFFSRFPLASKRVTTPAFWEILLIYGMLLLAANLLRWKRALYLLITLASLFAAGQVYQYRTLHLSNELTVTFLDVGQGDAAVVFFPGGKVMVVDGGGSPDGSFDPGERIVAPFLWKEKRGKIDYLVNTHPHPDHLQGLLFLLENFPVERVWHNGAGKEENPLLPQWISTAAGRLQVMGRGEIPLQVGGVNVEFLHPPLSREEGISFTGNDASIVIRLTYGEVTFLLCGDVESAAEEELLRHWPNLQSTVLKVPHHGSRTSSTPRFVEAVRPKFIVYTVKPGGRHRLPHPSVMERYEAIGAHTFRSDRDGAVTFVTNGKELQVKTFSSPRGATRENAGQARPSA